MSPKINDHSGRSASTTAKPSTAEGEGKASWLGVPAPVWVRVLVLFFGLAALKGVLLCSLGKHLYEIHWRISTPDVSWINRAAFYGFLGLGAWSLWDLGQRCRLKGKAAVRTANAIVLALGLAFIFLRFHSGDKNYIYPVLTGILQPRDLVPYLNLDCFFRPPFLAFWLGGYALIYYGMARTGRESWMLHVTAIAAAVYGLLYLQELTELGTELLLADGLGLTALLLARPLRQGLKLRWLLAPLAWMLLFLVPFFLVAPELKQIEVYLRMLLESVVVLFAGATLLAWRQKFLEAWAGRLLFWLGAFLLLTNNHYPMAANYNNLLSLALGTPRYFMGELLLALGLAAAGTLSARLWPKATLWWLDAIILSTFSIALADLRLTQIMGVRLGWDVVEFADSPKMMWRMAKPYLPLLGLGIALLAAGYYLLLKWLRSRRFAGALQPQRLPIGAVYVCLLFALLGALSLAVSDDDKAQGQSGVQLALNNPWLKHSSRLNLSPEQFLEQSEALGLKVPRPAAPVASAPTETRKELNVILVFLESSYNKHLSLFGSSEPTQPLLSRYRDRMELFPNFFSAFAGSIHARFATFTSLYPVRDFNTFTEHRVPVKSIFEVLQENGYACSLFYSSFLDYTGFRDFLKQRGIGELYDADTMPGQRKSPRLSWGLREEETLSAMQAHIKQHAAAGQRFFMTYVPAAPHYPYDGIPKEFAKYKIVQMGDFTPVYLNELLYIDWVLASILDQLKECGVLDQTLVVITNDHGEMLGDNGNPIGHGWAVTPELANTPLIILNPLHRGPRINYTVGSQIDLLPTMLESLSIPVPADQLYEGRSLYATNRPADRVIYCNAGQQFGVVVSNRFLCGDRPKQQSQAATICRAYSISNQETKTLFTPEPEVTNRIDIGLFDRFQEGLLRNYSVLARELCSPHSSPPPSR